MTAAEPAADSQLPRRDRRLAAVLGLLLLLPLCILLAMALTLNASGLPSGLIFAPLRSILNADYSADPRGTHLAEIDLGLVEDVINEDATSLAAGTLPPDRLATLISALSTPVATVTLLPGAQPHTPTPSRTPSVTPTRRAGAASPTRTRTPTPTILFSPTPSRTPTATSVVARTATRPPSTATATFVSTATNLPPTNTEPPPLPATNTNPPPPPPTATTPPPTNTSIPPSDTPPPPPPSETPPSYPATDPPPTSYP